jgi:phenylacetate-coenzyme A ligase PaaK-like adenylate-forming protein
MARTLSMAGCEKGDTVQNGYGYGLFTGGLGVHYGARRIGANILPISSGNTRRQLHVMRDFGTTLLTCTPSYSLFLAEAAREEGIDFRDMPLKAGCFGAEPWSENMRVEIEAKLDISAHDIYGLTELIGPGVAAECECKHGQHFNEDYFYPEIINPETGEVLPDGEKGELVITSLQREGSPLLRYRTRDITFLMRDPCPCGRTTVRIHRLLGRTDDMMIVRGVNIFPSQIENVLMRIEGTQPHYQIVIDRGATHLDEIEIRVEVEDAVFSDVTSVRRPCYRHPHRFEPAGERWRVHRAPHRRDARRRAPDAGRDWRANAPGADRRHRAAQHRAQRRQGATHHRPEEHLMIIKQISIFMENTTGRLADVTALLAQAGTQQPATRIVWDKGG